MSIKENLLEIKDKISKAEEKAERKPGSVKLMAVSKFHSLEEVQEAVKCGKLLFGENRVQEFVSKKDSYDKSAQVHFIGHLQTNKVKYIIQDVSMIQSVDSVKLAEQIDRSAFSHEKIMDVLVEVNVGEEATKSGVSYDKCSELIHEISQLENIRVKGLMAIPPVGCDEGVFEKMHELYLKIGEMNIKGVSMQTLSMGMSGDYELAIKHGSNLVRIGTKLFGARKYFGG